jgi:hypothetical protein
LRETKIFNRWIFLPTLHEDTFRFASTGNVRISKKDIHEIIEIVVRVGRKVHDHGIRSRAYKNYFTCN